MRRFTLTLALAVMAALLPASLAHACINDSETIRTEADFKKHYEFKSGYQQPEGPTGPAGTRGIWGPMAAAVVGLGMLLGGAVVVTVNVRNLR